MSKRIKKLIKKARHWLQWPVREARGPDERILMICSDHINKTHTIHIPDHDVRDIEYLHEFAHATLCETVNPMFSTQYFERGIGQEIVSMVQPASQGASDWFADHWVYGFAPAEIIHEIEDHLKMVVKVLENEHDGSPTLFTGAALMLAQGEKYCDRKFPLVGSLRQGVDVLLSIDPAKPTIKKLEAAVNGLLACYTPLRVEHIVDDEGLDCWRVEKKINRATPRESMVLNNNSS